MFNLLFGFLSADGQYTASFFQEKGNNKGNDAGKVRTVSTWIEMV